MLMWCGDIESFCNIKNFVRIHVDQVCSSDIELASAVAIYQLRFIIRERISRLQAVVTVSGVLTVKHNLIE